MTPYDAYALGYDNVDHPAHVVLAIARDPELAAAYVRGAEELAAHDRTAQRLWG